MTLHRLLPAGIGIALAALVAFSSISSLSSRDTTRARGFSGPLTSGTSIGIFTATTSGIVPATGGSTGKFLRDDQTWATTGGVASVGATLPLVSSGGLNPVISANTFSSGTSGIVPASGGASTQYLAADGTWKTPPFIASATAALAADFGTGADGACNFDGVATVCGAVPSSGVYTLPRDCDCANGTIAAGKRVFENGFHLHDTGTLTCNGQIDYNGNSAIGTGGAASNAAQIYPATVAGNTEAGGGGVSASDMPLNYVLADQASQNGAATGGQNPGLPGSLGVAHSGGSGASGGGCTGVGQGVAGKSTGGYTHAVPGRGSLTTWGWYDFRFPNRGVSGQFGMASGGGPGGGGIGGPAGGGAGASGGVAYVVARKLAGTCAMQARGGNGGNGANGNASTQGGGGGGGGGAGGWLYLEYVTNTGAWAVDANGGQPGSGGTASGSCFNGGTGGSGGPGSVEIHNLSGDGT